MMQSDPDLKPFSLLMFVTSQICLRGKKKKYSIAISCVSGKNTVLQFFGFYAFSHWSLSRLSSQITLSHEENAFYIISGGNLVYWYIICRPSRKDSL